MNTAWGDIKFPAFCVVSRSGLKAQRASTLDDAEAIVAATLGPSDTICAIYGKGSGNRIALYYFELGRKVEACSKCGTTIAPYVAPCNCAAKAV